MRWIDSTRNDRPLTSCPRFRCAAAGVERLLQLDLVTTHNAHTAADRQTERTDPLLQLPGRVRAKGRGTRVTLCTYHVCTK
jgi:hypothetical protein